MLPIYLFIMDLQVIHAFKLKNHPSQQNIKHLNQKNAFSYSSLLTKDLKPTSSTGTILMVQFVPTLCSLLHSASDHI